MNSEALFHAACEVYNRYGVDVAAAIEKLARIKVSIHAWQGDDVTGFENTDHALTGGCQVTGNYPGRARNAEELRQDLTVAMKLIPGRHRVCLQAHQVDKMLPGVDRNDFSIDNFSGWRDWSVAEQLPLDIAPAFYSHPNLQLGASLSHRDHGIRQFWIEHGRAVRRIGAEFGRALNTVSICNLWIPDGSKDTPADRFSPRVRLRDALDTIFSDEIDPHYLADAVESKLFGIGAESYTVGSHDFCLSYAARRNKLICLDTGHFHPTESIADKLSAIVAMQGQILLHVSRGVRWDSDHVITLADGLLQLAREALVYDYADRIYFCLDYFDASINRVAAWVIGTRNLLKSLLIALLEPSSLLIELENAGDFSGRLALQEEVKELPWQWIWHYYCELHGVPPNRDFMKDIRRYEQKVLPLRGN